MQYASREHRCSMQADSSSPHISFDSRSHASGFTQPSVALCIQYVLSINTLDCASALIGLLMPLLTQGSVGSIQLNPCLQYINSFVHSFIIYVG